MFTESEMETILKAREISERSYAGKVRIGNPKDAALIFEARLRGCDREEFHVAFLDSRNFVIEFASMFIGTLNSVDIYPREIARRALNTNCAAVILAHNHPGGSSEPSRHDVNVTQRIGEVLKLFDIKTLDHFIVGSGEPYSMAEHGYT